MPFDVDAFVSDCRDAMQESTPQLAVRDVVERAVAEWTAALHVDGGDFFSHPRLQWDKITGEPEPFDLANARRLVADTEERARSAGAIDDV